MGNICTCFEGVKWDAHPEIVNMYSPKEKGVYQDMTQPLPSYFISSGHNSYLTGDQLISPAGTSTIVKCLKAGCRVVELDVYNGPQCKHGGTLTSPVGFKECIEAIRDYAFVASPYPVIITMENHTDVENQGIMAEILRDVLGERLFVPDPNDPMSAFASPEALKNKVLCRMSVKKTGKYHPGLMALIYIRNVRCGALSDMIKMDKVASSSFEERALPESDELGGKNAAEQADEELKRLLAKQEFKEEYDKKQFDEQDPEDAVLPGGESVAGSLQELYMYTTKHLMRIYPAGWRVASGNYNPMLAWTRGASLAALNWQNWGQPLWCNEGKFMDNGGCGYVLKPGWMRSPGTKLPTRQGRKLHVYVYSAHLYQGNQFSVFKDDLYVKIGVWGMPIDCGSQFTRASSNTGRLKVEEDFEFTVHFPEMAVLRLELKDDDSMGDYGADKRGYFTLPLSIMAEGEFKLELKSPDDGSPLNKKDAWIKVRLAWQDGGGGENPMYSARPPPADPGGLP